jgi:hypothetical protein
VSAAASSADSADRARVFRGSRRPAVCGCSTARRQHGVATGRRRSSRSRRVGCRQSPLVGMCGRDFGPDRGPRTRDSHEAPGLAARRRLKIAPPAVAKNRLLILGPRIVYNLVQYTQLSPAVRRGGAESLLVDKQRRSENGDRHPMPCGHVTVCPQYPGASPRSRNASGATNATESTQTPQFQGAKRDAVHSPSNRGRSLRRGATAQGVGGQ